MSRAAATSTSAIMAALRRFTIQSSSPLRSSLKYSSGSGCAETEWIGAGAALTTMVNEPMPSASTTLSASEALTAISSCARASGASPQLTSVSAYSWRANAMLSGSCAAAIAR